MGEQMKMVIAIPARRWRRWLMLGPKHIYFESDALTRADLREWLDQFQQQFPMAAVAVEGDGWRELRTPLDGRRGKWSHPEEES